MNFPLYIAQRYVRSKSSQNAVNIINFITFLVIVIGSAALFIVLSGFAGLKNFSLSFTTIFDPDLKVVPMAGKFFSVSAEQEAALSKINGIAFYSKEIEEKVVLSHKGKTEIASIKGVDTNYNQVTGVGNPLYFGEWHTDSLRGVAGLGIVSKLGVTINQFQNPLTILAPKPGRGSLSQQSLVSDLYNELPLIISGAYAVEADLDKKYVFIDLPLAQALLEKEDTQVSGINIKVVSESEEALGLEIKNKVASLLGNGVVVKDRRELNSTLHRMLNTENLATYLIFTLVLIIALFNVVGAIIMMILDKQQNSKTLYSLGTTIQEIRHIYFIQGVIVTSFGGLIGVFLGALLIGSQSAFGWLKITPSLVYPVAFQFINVIIVLATIVILGIIASKIASSRINDRLVNF